MIRILLCGEDSQSPKATICSIPQKSPQLQKYLIAESALIATKLHPPDGYLAVVSPPPDLATAVGLKLADLKGPWGRNKKGIIT